MQAVILAAGKSTRTYPLTLTKPKTLLKIGGKTVLERNLEQLDGLVSEVVVVVGYKKNMVVNFLKKVKNRFKFKIRFVEQSEQLGSGHAILQVKDILKNRFVVLNGDDIYSKEDIRMCLKYKYAVLAKESRETKQFGMLKTRRGLVLEIVEKPSIASSNLVNTGLYVFDKKIFDIKLAKSERGEYEITDFVKKLAKTEDIKVVEAKNGWFPIGYPWDILTANEQILKELKRPENNGRVEKGATAKGPVVIGKDSIIRSGSYIEGPVIVGQNSVIGPNAYIRPFSCIGDNCKIGSAVEVKNTIIGDSTNANHLSYVGDSIIGDGVNLGAGTITANLRHDGKNVKSLVKGEMIDTGRRKFGTAIGDGVKTGINTSIYPGRKIWPGMTTLPGEIVKKDKHTRI